MIRKLIQLSPSTSVVSLPSSWIKGNNLKKGNDLNVEVNDNKVVVSAKRMDAKKEIKINVSKLKGRLFWIAIDTAYISGYDSIIIQTRDSEQNSYMNKVVRYFPGMMIIDEHKNYVHFKSMEESSPDLDKIISRIFNLTISLMEDSMDAIKLKKWDDLLRVKYRDYVINSYISYCLRSINKFGNSPFSKIGVFHSFLKILEIFSDKLCLLFRSIAKHKSNPLKPKTLNLVLDMYKQIRRIHFKYSPDDIIKIEENRLKLLEIIKSMPSYSIYFLNDLADLFFTLEELEMQLHS